jgi:hypothetical protein
MIVGEKGRASHYGSEGREFESLQAHETYQQVTEIHDWHDCFLTHALQRWKKNNGVIVVR